MALAEALISSYSNVSQGPSSSVCLLSLLLLMFWVSSAQLTKLHLQVAPADVTHSEGVDGMTQWEDQQGC